MFPKKIIRKSVSEHFLETFLQPALHTWYTIYDVDALSSSFTKKLVWNYTLYLPSHSVLGKITLLYYKFIILRISTPKYLTAYKQYRDNRPIIYLVRQYRKRMEWFFKKVKSRLLQIKAKILQLHTSLENGFIPNSMLAKNIVLDYQ